MLVMVRILMVVVIIMIIMIIMIISNSDRRKSAVMSEIARHGLVKIWIMVLLTIMLKKTISW